jgi:hypothetical protein
MLFFERNEDAITRIGQALSEKSVDVMAHRMEDQAISEPLRLLYASILAAANDPRGRARLLAAAKDDKSPFFGDAVFCVAQSAFLIEPNAPIHTDMSWAETILIDLLPKQVPAWQGELQPAVTTAPVVGALLRVNTDRARRALIDFAASKAEGADEVRAALCDSDVTIAHDDLDRFDVAAKPSGNRRAVLNKMLRQDDPDVVARSCDDLADGFIYSSYREHLTPQIVSALRAAIPKAPDKCKSDMRMLVILASEDPVPEIVQLLEDPAWTDKNTALFELARIKDPRAVPIVGRILREAPPAYFHTDSALRANVAVEHALAAIANVATTEAARELATLFDVDLTRFGGYTDNNGFQRIIASHLIDITGESFGIDVEDWHKALR